MTEKNALYWSYNIPLQVWPQHQNPEDTTSPIVGYEVVNYSPRKEKCVKIDQHEFSELLESQSSEEFFNTAAEKLEALAKKFRQMAKNEISHIYYPD